MADTTDQSRSAGQTGASGREAVSGLVKWFDAARGFGFLLVGERGQDAFLHASVLARAGESAPGKGDRVSGLLAGGGGRLSVAAVLRVERAADGEGAPGARRGTVKFYDQSRGYGFISMASGVDVFVGAKTLRRLGLTPLREGQAVLVTVSGGQDGHPVAELVSFMPQAAILAG